MNINYNMIVSDEELPEVVAQLNDNNVDVDAILDELVKREVNVSWDLGCRL